MPTTDTSEQIVWDFNIPLVTNPDILRDLAKVLAITFVAMSSLFMLIGICQGVDELRHMLPLIPMFAICDLVVGVLCIMVMLLFYRNRFPCRFVVGAKGVAYEVTASQRKLNRAIFILGALGGKPGVAGSALLARSQESDSYDWAEVHRVDLFPSRRVVCIRNSWRTLLRIYCTPDNYEAVAAIAVDGVERAGEERARRIARGRIGRSTILKRLAWWPVIFVAAFLSFAQPLLDDKTATIWIACLALVLGAVFGGPARRVMGGFGLIASAATVVVVVTNGLKVTSFARGFIHWNGFQAATDTQDMPFFIIGCIGILGLVAVSLRHIVTGRADRS